MSKITTLEQLTRVPALHPIIHDSRPSIHGPRVVLTHGCFDGLHPGHLRHLQAAKAQGDVLVVSVTTDAWVGKGPGRPYIPDHLRAELLAALECVDYVILTPGGSAEAVIRALKPDVFAKGADYNRLETDLRTAGEMMALKTYGGVMYFTSDDVRFSSTQLGAPRLTLPDFSGLRVHVIGDAIRDVYTQAKCLGAASKSPTLVYERGESQEWEGGAIVVAQHCVSAGAEVTLSHLGETRKERILVEGVKVLEFHSRPDRASTHDRLIKGIIEGIGTTDVVIFADFGHGMFTTSVPAMKNAVPDGVLTAADSQTTDISWGNIGDFRGCDLLFANEREARFALRRQDLPVETIGTMLWGESAAVGTKAVFLKRGAQGLWLYSAAGRQDLPPYASQPIVDPIGAGDALLAYATLTYAVSKDLELAGQIGSLAAAEACAHLGNVPVTRAAIQARCQRF